MAFKTKTKIRLLKDERQTLDAKHNNILNSFIENKDNIQIIYEELKSINNKLNELYNKNKTITIFDINLQNQI